MKCYTTAQLEEALVNRDPLLKAHLEQCPACLNKYRAAAEDQELWHARLYPPDELPSVFTDSVMRAIGDLPLSPASTSSFSEPGVIRPSGIKPLRKVWFPAAALVLLAVILLLNASPQLSGLLQPLLSSSSGKPESSMFSPLAKTDAGLREAQKLGIVQNPHVHVTDKGYTLTINEVVADSNRLVLALALTNSEGYSEPRLLDVTKIRVTDSSGQDIGRLTYQTDEASYSQLTFFYDREVTEQQLNVMSKIGYLGGQDIEDAAVTGNWDFSFNVDLKKAQKLSVVSPLEDKYTSPDGLNIKADQLVRTPTGAMLYLQTSFGEKLASLTSPAMRKRLLLMYHFEDAEGNIVAEVNSYGLQSSSALLKQNFLPAEQDGKLHWTYNFTGLDYDKKPLDFVLDGYSLPVNSTASVTFRPAELKNNPAVFTDSGDTLTFKDMEIKREEKRDDPGGWITVSGEYSNMVWNDQWIARDEQGNEYNAEFAGGVALEVKNGVMRRNNAFLHVKNMKALPQQLTLIRKVRDTRFTNVNWRFELPRIDSYPGIE